jgi:hypothetical protein
VTALPVSHEWRSCRLSGPGGISVGAIPPFLGCKCDSCLNEPPHGAGRGRPETLTLPRRSMCWGRQRGSERVHLGRGPLRLVYARASLPIVSPTAGKHAGHGVWRTAVVHTLPSLDLKRGVYSEPEKPAGKVSALGKSCTLRATACPRIAHQPSPAVSKPRWQTEASGSGNRRGRWWTAIRNRGVQQHSASSLSAGHISSFGSLAFSRRQFEAQSRSREPSNRHDLVDQRPRRG